MVLVTTTSLESALRDAGLGPGDAVLVHSSLRSVGPVDGGPANVVSVMLDLLGPSGILMVPTFTYTRDLIKPWFDSRTTAGLTGALAEAVRRWPGSVRSLHPTHSVAAIGSRADEMTTGHLQVRALGIGSPIDRLAQAGGKVLLIGVDHRASSTIHVGEERAGVAKGAWYDHKLEAMVRLPGGELVSHEVDDSPSCSAAFNAIDGPLRDRQLVIDGKVGGAALQVMRASDVVETVVALLRDDPRRLLCTWAGCRPCTGARALRGAPIRTVASMS